MQTIIDKLLAAEFSSVNTNYLHIRMHSICFQRSAIRTEPSGAAFHTARLALVGALDLRGEFLVADEVRLPFTLSVRAAETKFPQRRTAFENLVAATGVGIVQRNFLSLDLLCSQAHLYATGPEPDAVLGHHSFHHLPLLGRQVLHLRKHFLHAGHGPAAHRHVVRADLPDAGLEIQSAGQGWRQAEGYRQNGTRKDAHGGSPERIEGKPMAP